MASPQAELVQRDKSHLEPQPSAEFCLLTGKSVLFIVLFLTAPRLNSLPLSTGESEKTSVTAK